MSFMNVLGKAAMAVRAASVANKSSPAGRAENMYKGQTDGQPQQEKIDDTIRQGKSIGGLSLGQIN